MAKTSSNGNETKLRWHYYSFATRHGRPTYWEVGNEKPGRSIPCCLSSIFTFVNEKRQRIHRIYHNRPGRNEPRSNSVLKFFGEAELPNYCFEKNGPRDPTTKITTLCKKTFQADGVNKKDGVVVEIEAGRGLTNKQFLKDIVEACVSTEPYSYVVIVMPIHYKGRNDFDQVLDYVDAIWCCCRESTKVASNSVRRFCLPLSGILLIGC